MPKLLPGLLAILIAAVVSWLTVDMLPERVPTHWGLDGQPDGYSSPGVAAFLLPGFALVLAAILAFVPRLDPRQEAYTQPGSPYWIIANATLVFMAALHLTIIGFAFGWPIPIGTVVPVGVGILFVVIGALMERMPPSWFMGIRTPWTLSNDEVWRKTHQVGGICFIVAGLILVVAGFVKPEGLLITLLVVAGVSAAVPVAYSWVLWRRAGGPPGG
jgi:uncharacterized membrane protein